MNCDVMVMLTHVRTEPSDRGAHAVSSSLRARPAAGVTNLTAILREFAIGIAMALMQLLRRLQQLLAMGMTARLPAAAAG